MARKNKRRMILLRGLPGSGKNTLGELYGQSAIAADDYFTDPEGNYAFDAGKLPAAHAWCQQEAARELLSCDTVIVANTFSQRWELQPYLDLAAELREGGHTVQVHIVDLYDGGLTDAELAERNTHGVPLHTISRMRARWEADWRAANPIPPWER